MRKTGLGRGLSELISGEALARTRAVIEVGLDRLEPNPYQPRHAIDDDSLEELTLSIEAHGVVQPVVVRRTDSPDVYQIIAGERRWRAASRAGLQTVPCIVQDASDERALEIALVENLQRSDLGPLETAHALRHLMQEFGLTQEQVAEQIGRSRSSVANTLRLLDLPEVIREALAAGRITAGHARALLSMSDEPERMMAAFQRIEAEGLSVRETEALGRAPAEDAKPEVGETAPPAAQPTDPHIEEVKRRLRDRLGTKVTVLPRSRGGGTINIAYHDAEDLDRLLALIAPAGPRSYSTME